MIAFTALACLLVGFAETPLDVARKVGTEERRAFLAKDYAAYERLLTPDFVPIGTKGERLNKRQAILVERDARERIVKIPKIGGNVSRVGRSEGGILVERRVTLTGLFKAKRGNPFLGTFTGTESLLMRQNGVWRVKRTRVLSYNWVRG